MNFVKTFKDLPPKTKTIFKFGFIIILFIALPIFVWAITNLNFNPKEKASIDGNISATHHTAWSSTGEQKVLVILYNFQDNPNNKPFTKEEVEQSFFSENYSVNSIIKSLSFNSTYVTGTVVDWFTTPITNSFNGQPSCIASSGESYALDNARTNGIDVDTYTRFVFIYPNTQICGQGASGSTGGNPSHIEINGSIDKYLIVHELIHNFGAGHSHFLKCGDKQIKSYDLCQIANYGDVFSIMGSGIVEKDIPSFQKNFLGWIPDSDILEVTQSGTYNLKSIKTDTGTRSIKIQKADTNEYYYLDYDPQYGTLIRIGFYSTVAYDQSIYESAETKLIDSTPDTYTVVDDASLSHSDYFYDEVNDITIKQLSTTNDSTVIQIDILNNSENSPSPSPFDLSTIMPTPTETSNDTDLPTPTATTTSTSNTTSQPTATPTEASGIGGYVEGEPNSCGGTCGSNYNCKANLYCYQGFCRNPICSSETDCDCSVSATATATAKSSNSAVVSKTSTAKATSKSTAKGSAKPTPTHTSGMTLIDKDEDLDLVRSEDTITTEGTENMFLVKYAMYIVGALALFVIIVLISVFKKKKDNNIPHITPPTNI